MKIIDKQIIAAERDLDALAHDWKPAIMELHAPADRMHALLVTEGSPEEAELAALTDAIEAYEAVR